MLRDLSDQNWKYQELVRSGTDSFFASRDELIFTAKQELIEDLASHFYSDTGEVSIGAVEYAQKYVPSLAARVRGGNVSIRIADDLDECGEVNFKRVTLPRYN